MPTETVLDPEKLERIVPDLLDSEGPAGAATLERHMARYQFAAKHVGPGTLLDIACGVGYGASYLKRECPQLTQVTGVDISFAAIGYAKSHYHAQDIQFVEADAMTFWQQEGFANIVTLETIEHLHDPAGFLRRMSALLRHGGVLIGSAPVTPSMDCNPNHLSDFNEQSFRLLGRSCDLEEFACFEQEETFDAKALLRGTVEDGSAGTGGWGFYKKNPDKLLSRIQSTFQHGFKHRYLTIAWNKVF